MPILDTTVLATGLMGKSQAVIGVEPLPANTATPAAVNWYRSTKLEIAPLALL